MSTSDLPPVGNRQIAGKPGAGKTFWPTTFAGEGTSMLSPALDDSASTAAAYVDAFALTREEFARIRLPKQA
jgi:hypothetical protein